MENIFYVYEWFIIDTNEVFYIGKGTGDRCFEHKRRNKMFKDFYNSHNCDVRIVKNNLTEQKAFEIEKETISYYRNNTDYRLSNRTDGGNGGNTHKHYSKEKMDEYLLKSSKSRKGKVNQGENNPMYGKSYREGKNNEELLLISEKQRIGNLGQKRSDESKKKMSVKAKERECKLPPKEKRPCMILKKDTFEIIAYYDKITDAEKNGYVKGNLSRKAKGICKNDKEDYIIMYIFYYLNEKL